MKVIVPRFFASAQNDSVHVTLCRSEKCNNEESKVSGECSKYH